MCVLNKTTQLRGYEQTRCGTRAMYTPGTVDQETLHLQLRVRNLSFSLLQMQKARNFRPQRKVSLPCL